MKIAKLPTGKVLKFPDETPDEAIDYTVRAHLDSHTKKTQEEANKVQQAQMESVQRHDQIVQGLDSVSQLLHHLIKHTVEGHVVVGNALRENTQAHLKPKKTKAIRDDKGKITGAEEYV